MQYISRERYKVVKIAMLGILVLATQFLFYRYKAEQQTRQLESVAYNINGKIRNELYKQVNIANKLMNIFEVRGLEDFEAERTAYLESEDTIRSVGFSEDTHDRKMLGKRNDGVGIHFPGDSGAVVVCQELSDGGYIELEVGLGYLFEKDFFDAIKSDYAFSVKQGSSSELYRYGKESLESFEKTFFIEGNAFLVGVAPKPHIQNASYFYIVVSVCAYMLFFGVYLQVEKKADSKERYIKDLKDLQKTVEYQAYFDELTGIFNRRKIMQILESQTKEPRKGSYVVLMDLDNFKHINDTLGHSTGDMMLKEVARRIKVVSKGKAAVARLGGDEFLLVLPNTSNPGVARNLCDNIKVELSQPYILDEKVLETTTSMGISKFPEDGLDVDTLVKKADTAMYTAKESGKNSYSFFTKEMGEALRRRKILEEELKFAAAYDEFYMVYQPQVRICGLETVGVEALIRWRSTTLGDVSPVEFLRVLEETGGIKDVGLWVFDTVCRQMREWDQKGVFVENVSVNISAVQIDRALLSDIEKIRARWCVDAERITLELTEQAVVEDVEKCVRWMSEIREKGYRIAMDDFGTGYSSLNYLAKLPLDVLKIDKSFVDRVESEGVDRIVMDGIVRLSKRLSLSTVIEGVETKEQIAVLKRMGDVVVQGYYFSKPLEARGIEEYLKERCA